jgi:hypothetical protein
MRFTQDTITEEEKLWNAKEAVRETQSQADAYRSRAYKNAMDKIPVIIWRRKANIFSGMANSSSLNPITCEELLEFLEQVK